MRLAAILGLLFCAACAHQGVQAPMAQPAQASSAPDMASFQVKDIQVGTGDEALSGKRVSVRYKGQVEGGRSFDSSQDWGSAFYFTLGANQVIQGWEMGVTGMRVGGKRHLRIPPAMAYGGQGASEAGIPANATLTYEIELLGVQ